jgi:hypothetical protein
LMTHRLLPAMGMIHQTRMPERTHAERGHLGTIRRLSAATAY